MEPTKEQNTSLGDNGDGSSASEEDLTTVLRRKVKTKYPDLHNLAPVPEGLKNVELRHITRNDEHMSNTPNRAANAQDGVDVTIEPATASNPAKKRKISGQYSNEAQHISNLRSNTQAEASSAGVKKPRSGQKVLSKEEKQKQVRKHPETYNGNRHVNEGEKQRNAADRSYHLRRTIELKALDFAASFLEGETLAKFKKDMVTERDKLIQNAKAKDPDAAAYLEKSIPKEPVFHRGKHEATHHQTRDGQMTDKPRKTPTSSLPRTRSRSPRGGESTRKPASADHRTINGRKPYHTPRRDGDRGGGNHGGEQGQGPGPGPGRGKRGGGASAAAVAVVAPDRGPRPRDQAYVDPVYKWKYTLHRLDDVRDLDVDVDAAADLRARATQLPESFAERRAANRRLDELTAFDDADAVVRRATALDTPLRLLRVDVDFASGRRARWWVDRQCVHLARDLTTTRERSRKKWSGARPRMPHFVVECEFLTYECVDANASTATGNNNDDDDDTDDCEDSDGHSNEDDAPATRIQILLPKQQQRNGMDVDDADADTQQLGAGGEPESSPPSPPPTAVRDEHKRQQQLRRIADSLHPSPSPSPAPSYPLSVPPPSSPPFEIRIHPRRLPLATFTERGLANAHASETFLACSRVARSLRNALDDYWWAQNAVEADGEARSRSGGGRGEGGDGDGGDGDRGLYSALLETGGMRTRLGYDRLYVRVHAVEDVQGPVNI
ncbi:hypothetical protein F4775DRAFT_601086 [Biscogniauxia sp. FL1348]|nr:hypothetical protein F4775DRAFT_601086 [Biscogniauxia sp. FL1348]